MTTFMPVASMRISRVRLKLGRAAGQRYLVFAEPQPREEGESGDYWDGKTDDPPHCYLPRCVASGLHPCHDVQPRVESLLLLSSSFEVLEEPFHLAVKHL